MGFSSFDQECMKLALREARKGLGKTFPNPCVGAVIAKHGKVLASGFHARAGMDHAEIVALKKLGFPSSKRKISGADLYVTLEPCAFVGRTPPCMNAIEESGIARVFFAIRDPHDDEHLSEKTLKKHGVKVFSGLLEEESRTLNQFFLKNVLKKMPYVTSKVAMTLDGKIATSSGDSRGISSLESTHFVHSLRAVHQAIVVGVGTVGIDNPNLGVRFGKTGSATRGPDPLRVILDSKLLSDLSAQVFRDENVVVFTTTTAPLFRKKAFLKKGIRVVSCGKTITPRIVLRKLFTMGICSVFVEGGSQVLTSFWEAGMIDRYMTLIAPKLAGGKAALTPLSGKGISKVSRFSQLQRASVSQFGSDVLVDGYLNWY
ncbi:MAG: bifunctional diaminohydroxyphosphoribosylaminopyrimidine deaminase/5-amino-6-(5-phosphoribosylamino)uracil reductase RibD [Patescibacteria group bacterium]